jgi:hypothetical protein
MLESMSAYMELIALINDGMSPAEIATELPLDLFANLFSSNALC